MSFDLFDYLVVACGYPEEKAGEYVNAYLLGEYLPPQVQADIDNYWS